jgi:Ca2+-binding EF-hand superfamily protein
MIRAILLTGTLALAAAAPADPAPEALAFDRFIATSSPVCLHQPARRCVDAGFAFADANGDGALSRGEVRAVRADLDRWLAWRGPQLQPRERGAVMLGAQLIDAAGLDRLFDSYDADGDGRITKRELLADVRLDERPLGEVLMDEKAVDRQAVQRRLGALAPAVEGMLRKPR